MTFSAEFHQMMRYTSAASASVALTNTPRPLSLCLANRQPAERIDEESEHSPGIVPSPGLGEVRA